MAADDHVLHAEDVDRVLEHREAVEVGVHDDVRDVAVHEHLARREADDLVRRHAAVGAADPEVLGRLLLGELGEEVAVAGDHLRRPGAVVLEELREIRHRVDATRLRASRVPWPAWTARSRANRLRACSSREVMIANPKTLPAGALVGDVRARLREEERADGAAGRGWRRSEARSSGTGCRAAPADDEPALHFAERGAALDDARYADARGARAARRPARAAPRRPRRGWRHTSRASLRGLGRNRLLRPLAPKP